MSHARVINKTAAAGCRRRVAALVKSLPEAWAIRAGDSLEVRSKRFGWFLHDHHGDGRLALNLKAPRGANRSLATNESGRFHAPKYIGHHGWVGVWPDSPAPDWGKIKKLLEEAYSPTAPKGWVKIVQTTHHKEKP
jgi:hypothetical protein